jgi:hypothetical protein
MSESDGTRGEWVVAATCTWLHEAQFLKSVLESVGIIATIRNEHTLGVQPLYSNLLGGAQVMVQAADLSRAKEVLESAAVEPATGDDDDAV